MSAPWSRWTGRSIISLLSESAWDVNPWKLSHTLRNYAKKVPSSGWKNITSKRGKLNFYKGRGVASAGVNSSKGRFTVLPSRSPNYIIPDVRGSRVCSLTSCLKGRLAVWSQMKRSTACVPIRRGALCDALCATTSEG